MAADSSGTAAIAGRPPGAATDMPTRVSDERLAQVLRAHGPSLRRLCAVYENDPAERHDLLQEVMFAIWRALPSFRGECSERTFVYRIAYNRALSHRFRRRLPAVDLSAADAIADPMDTPAVAVERASEHDRLRGAVAALPARLREAVVLRLEGLSDREIADVLGLSEGNVAVRLTRARHALRAILRPPHDTGTD